MFDSVVIDVVIALAVIFLVFSLVTAGLREFISRVLETRAKELWRAIRRLVDDPILSDLREVRAIAATRDEQVRVELLEEAERAEQLLRERIAAGDTGGEWPQSVAGALDPIVAIAPDDLELAAAVERSSKRLLLEHASANPRWHGARRAARRGGERPVAPTLPQAPSVADLAASIRNKSRTLTDAIHEHPLVRQLDRTWPGFHSRMQKLDRDDFSAAVTDLLGAVGVEESLRSAFAPLARKIGRYELTDDQKADMWQPIQRALDGIRTSLQSTDPDPEYMAAVLDSLPEQIAAAVDGVRDSLPDPGRVFGDLADMVEATRNVLALDTREPLDYVRIGAAALAGSAPVGDIVDRLAQRVRNTAAGAYTRMDALRTELGDWYDSRMDSLGEWYRKRSRFVAFGLGFFVVVSFNVDAVGLTNELWHNESIRDVVVALADESTVSLGECAALGEAGATTDGEDSDAEAPSDDATQDGEAEAVGGETPATSEECVDAEVGALLDTGLPLGWDWGTVCDGSCDGVGERLASAVGIAGRGVAGGLLKLLGWILAAAALAMGASFWYDVLTRATGIKKKAKEQ